MQGFLAGAQVIAQFSIWFLATAPAGMVEFIGGWWEISPEARLVHRGQGTYPGTLTASLGGPSSFPELSCQWLH